MLLECWKKLMNQPYGENFKPKCWFYFLFKKSSKLGNFDRLRLRCAILRVSHQYAVFISCTGTPVYFIFSKMEKMPKYKNNKVISTQQESALEVQPMSNHFKLNWIVNFASKTFFGYHSQAKILILNGSFKIGEEFCIFFAVIARKGSFCLAVSFIPIFKSQWTPAID